MPLRKKWYKTGVVVDAEEARRRREDNLVEIRKSKREESLHKKRREGFYLNQNLYDYQQQHQFSDFSKANVRIHNKFWGFGLVIVVINFMYTSNVNLIHIVNDHIVGLSSIDGKRSFI